MAVVLRRTKIRCRIMKAAKNLFSSRGQSNTCAPEKTSSAVQAGTADEKDLFFKLIAWENGELSQAETLAFFQDLVTAGLAWKSTGAVQRTAAGMIREGLIHR